MARYSIVAAWLLAAGSALAAAATNETAGWASPDEARRLAENLRNFLAGAEVRHPGSPGNLAMEARVARQFADSGLTHGDIRFTVPAFIPGRTALSLPDRPEPLRVSPLHPTLFRPGNFTERTFEAPLVYLGRGTITDIERIKGTSVTGAVAVMEFDCGTAWLDWLRFGVRGFIFLEPPRYERYEALSKVYTTEVAVPRFLAAGDTAQALRQAAEKGVTARIDAEPSRWENRDVRDLWVLIPGSDHHLSGEVAVITAPLDSNAIAPDHAYGAQSAVNLMLLTQLLETFRATPPKRSVLLAAVNAHTRYFQGERMLAWHLLMDRDSVERVRDLINTDLRMNQVTLKHYEALRLETARPEDEATLIRWRSLVDDTTARNITVKNPLVKRIKREVNRVKTEKAELAFSGLTPAGQAERRKVLDEEQVRNVNLLTLFNRVGTRTRLGQLTAVERQLLKSYVDEIVAFNRRCAELNARDLETELHNGAIRTALGGRRVAFAATLDADWDSPQMGFSVVSHAGRDKRWAVRFGIQAELLAQEMAADGGKPVLIRDTLSRRGGLTESYYFNLEPTPSTRPYRLTSPALAIQNIARIPSFSLRNTFTDFGRAFLPSDTVDNLDPRRTADSLAFLAQYWRVLLDDTMLTDPSQLGRPEMPPQGAAKAIQVKTFKFDELAASVFPEIPVAGSAVVLRYENLMWGTYDPFVRDAIRFGDVIFADLAMTDERATTVMYGLSVHPNAAPLRSGAYRYDQDFVRLDHAINAGETHAKVDSDRLHDDVILSMFECQEFPIYTMADSSLIANLPIALESIMPLTARGNSAPRKYGFSGVDSQLSSKRGQPSAGAPSAFYLDRRDAVKFVTRDKRVLLNSTEEVPEGRGVSRPADMPSDFFRQTVRDYSILNHARLLKLRNVANELVREFLDRGDAVMKRMEASLQAHDYLDYMQNLYEGLGAQVKSYTQAKQTTDDMLKAVVVYMALLLPFCLFVQKLCFNFVKIEHEMGMFAVLFSATYAVFRLIHPAFRVAKAAEAIFIAFVMGALGLFVISILRGRFEGEMQLLFRSFQGGLIDEDIGYSTVTQKAMLIGVNNMKRRRIRTMLTTATIVLIAFTMLSFTSISKKVNPTVIPRGKAAPYTGLMYHWPGRATLDDHTLKVMSELLAGKGRTVVRRWLVSSARIRVETDRNRDVNVEGILGLSAQEDGFADVLPLTAGRNFSGDGAPEALLFASMAEVLGIAPEMAGKTRIRVQGQDLLVVGILDDTLFRAVTDLNGLPLLPIKRVETSGGDLALPSTATRTSATEDIQDMGALFYVETSDLLVLPNGVAERLGARPYSLSIKIEDPARLWELADLIMTSTEARFYIGSTTGFTAGEGGRQKIGAGVYYIGSNYSTSVGGLAVLIIPLIIASTIILNTMLGSVYERKREIAIYNAVGLNPHHIGLFFLAESFVYGVIGSVGGYLIGQVLSLIIAHGQLVKGINFNYSSMSVAYVILLTIAIVLLSTVYPATVATRAAVPSGKRKWSLPPREGGRMSVVFPFIYTPQIASGVLSYLREYFARFTSASIGDLIATPQVYRRETDAAGRPCYSLDYHVALAPYDLGVTQTMRFRLAFDEHVKSYQLTLVIDRVSGQDTNWVTTNRPVLERLRKYLMRWRNLDLPQQGVYVNATETHFSNT